MAKQIKLKAQARTQVGRTAVKKIKHNGFVPAVIYGRTQQPLNLQLVAKEIETLLSRATSENVLVELEIADGAQVSSRLALIQEVQHHAVRRNVLHVDFHAVNADEELHTHVPVRVMGEAIGVRSGGGLLEVNMHSVEVACLPKDLPEFIAIDVSAMEVGQSIHVRDLPLPGGVSALAHSELTVLHVAAPKTEVAAEAATGAAAQPEVLKEKKPAAAAAGKK